MGLQPFARTMRTIIFILCLLMVEVSLIGQTLTGIVVSTNQPSTIQTDPSVDLWNLGAVAHPNGYLNAGGYLLNGQSLIGTANSFSYVIASNVVQSTVVSVVSNQIALNFATNINISGVGLSNGNASAQFLSVADSFLAAQTTNVVVVTNAGTDIAKGTYLISGTFAGFANYTNQGGIKITNSGSLWIIYQTGVGSLYSSATLINQAWTQVSGNTPVPVSRYGMDIYMNGDLWGTILSTNLSDRLARSSNDATSFSFSQMTNVVSITSNGIMVGVTNVFNSSTNATLKNSFTTNNESNARGVATNIAQSVLSTNVPLLAQNMSNRFTIIAPANSANNVTLGYQTFTNGQTTSGTLVVSNFSASGGDTIYLVNGQTNSAYNAIAFAQFYGPFNFAIGLANEGQIYFGRTDPASFEERSWYNPNGANHMKARHLWIDTGYHDDLGTSASLLRYIDDTNSIEKWQDNNGSAEFVINSRIPSSGGLTGRVTFPQSITLPLEIGTNNRTGFTLNSDFMNVQGKLRVGSGSGAQAMMGDGDTLNLEAVASAGTAHLTRLVNASVVGMEVTMDSSHLYFNDSDHSGNPVLTLNLDNTLSSSVGGAFTSAGNLTGNGTSNFMGGDLRVNGKLFSSIGAKSITNFVNGQYYTNVSGRTIRVQANAQLTTASIVGTSGFVLFSDDAGGHTFITNDTATIDTVIGSIGMTYHQMFGGEVTNGGCYYFTNVSSGVGDAAGLSDKSGRIITY